MGKWQTLKTKYPIRYAYDGEPYAMIGERGFANAGQFPKEFAIGYFKRYIKTWFIRLEYIGQEMYQIWLGGTR